MSRDEDRDMETRRKHAEALFMRFDAVQIFCTREIPNDGGTVACNYGKGNWHARTGQVREWALANAERVRARARQQEEGE